jgi:hypothetical protein
MVLFIYENFYHNLYFNANALKFFGNTNIFCAIRRFKGSDYNYVYSAVFSVDGLEILPQGVIPTKGNSELVIPFMVRQVHHERNQPNPSPFVLRFEGLVQGVLKGSSRIKWLIAVVLLVLISSLILSKLPPNHFLIILSTPAPFMHVTASCCA